MSAAGVPAVITLAYGFVKSMGWSSLTVEQEAALWPFVAAVVPLVTAAWARTKVSPCEPEKGKK